jgi:hypothetical protein
MFPELVWKSFGSWLRTIRPGKVTHDVKTQKRRTLSYGFLPFVVS